ncbi:MAG TPA: sigma factor-like helix-turn-helix DNA-binding protein [Streptosporangiaceae bacterium]|jgi:DNA-directed RNA polymerase specialized sigma24 family protein
MCDTDQQARRAGPPVDCQLHEAYYRQLVRLAALLTGDQDAAEEVAAAVLAALPPSVAAASESVARYLQRQVLVRCRRTAPGQSGQPGFAQLPVVRALQELPLDGREAVVLTHYLELTLKQAAVVAGVSQTVLHKRLDRAMQILQDRLPRTGTG